MNAEYNDETERRQRLRNRLVGAALGLLVLLVLTSLYGTFVTAPADRAKIEKTAGEAQRVSNVLAKSNAGLTALMCTGANRHDAVDLQILDALQVLGGDPAHVANDIPPATNCGELICQFFREINEPGAEITIKDPFGPDRPEVPCGPTPTPEDAAGP